MHTPVQSRIGFRYKQLVAYTLVKSGDSYLTYERTKKGGESRLWNKYSLGIGGHINIDDKAQSTLSTFVKHEGMTFFTQAVWRELREEIVIKSSHNPKLICFINDDSDDVGKTHFGMVWLLEIGNLRPIKGQKGLGNLSFCNINGLNENKLQFEHWSQLIIDYLSSGGLIGNKN